MIFFQLDEGIILWRDKLSFHANKILQNMKFFCKCSMKQQVKFRIVYSRGINYKIQFYQFYLHIKIM